MTPFFIHFMREYDLPQSANGATYNSQGPARSASPLVSMSKRRSRPERPKFKHGISPFQGSIGLIVADQGRRASRLPLAIIFRAVGANTIFRVVGA